jgi:hypothetical protein
LASGAPVVKSEVEGALDLLGSFYNDLIETHTALYNGEKEKQENFDQVTKKIDEDLKVLEV